MKTSKRVILIAFVATLILCGCTRFEDLSGASVPLDDEVASAFINEVEVPEGISVYNAESKDGINKLYSLQETATSAVNTSYVNLGGRAALRGFFDKVYYNGIATRTYVMYVYGRDPDIVDDFMQQYTDFAKKYKEENNE